MELNANHALRVIALKCFGPLDEAANLTRMATAASQPEISCWVQPMVDLALRERIEWQAFVTYLAEEHARAALACCALRGIEREVAEVVEALLALGTGFTSATTTDLLLFEVGFRGSKLGGGFGRAADGAFEEPLLWLASEADIDLLFADTFSHFADGLRFAADNACGNFQREMQSARRTHGRVFREVCLVPVLSATATDRSVRCAQDTIVRLWASFSARNAAVPET